MAPLDSLGSDPDVPQSSVTLHIPYALSIASLE
jgi:hypothetical protein